MANKETKGRVVRTTLDSLPYGDLDSPAATGRVTKLPMPEGIKRRTLTKDVLLIAWPSFVELVLTQLTSMADQMMVGRLPGTQGIMALSAVGLAAQPKFLLMTMVQAMNVGTTAMVARFRGQQNREKANQVFKQSLLLNIIICAVFMTVGLLTCGSLISLMGGKKMAPETFEYAVTYLNIQLYGFIPLCIGFTTTSALRGIGDTTTPMIYNTVANVVNIFFNYVMIYGHFGCPAMGVAGAAWATVIGQTVAFLIAVAVILRKKHYIYFSFKEKFGFDMDIMRNVANIGLPSMIEQLFMRAGVMVFVRVVAGLGDTMYAAHQILMNVQSLTFMIGQAFGNSTTTLVGQSLGKNRYDMAQHYMTEARHVAWIVAGVLALSVVTFRAGIIRAYNSNEDIIAIGSKILILLACTQPFQADQFVVAGGLRGAGDTRYSAMVIFVTTLGVRAGLSLLFVRLFNWGLWGAWIAIASDQLLRTALMVVRYQKGKWKKLSLKMAHAES